jgi:Tol biopolymer transport system component
LFIISCEKQDSNFSQTDAKIIFISRRIENSADWNLLIMNSDGSNQQRLTNTDRRNEDPVISSDGGFIIFSSNRDLSYSHDIFVMDVDGENQNPLSKYAGDDSFPVITNK